MTASAKPENYTTLTDVTMKCSCEWSASTQTQSAHAAALTKARNPAKVEIADLFAQGVSVQSKNFSCLDLIAARPGQCGGDQRRLEVVKHPVIKPDLRARAAKRVKEIS